MGGNGTWVDPSTYTIISVVANFKTDIGSIDQNTYLTEWITGWANAYGIVTPEPGVASIFNNRDIVELTDSDQRIIDFYNSRPRGNFRGDFNPFMFIFP